MLDTMKPMRKAVYSCIYNNITYKGSVVKVTDEKVFGGQQPSVYILLSTQREQNATEQDCAWQTRSSIDLLIISKTESEVSKDAIDDISSTMLQLLLNLPGDDNLTVQAGFQILELRKDSAASGQVQISPTQSELQKIVTITADIFHS